MTKTNFDKLVRWDADYYKSLTDDDCIVCLTEREVYLVGQILDMLRWKNTRWVGNLIGLDFDLIASNLEYKLSERMTCQNISTLLEKITTLENKIDYVFNSTATDNGDTPPTESTPAWDETTPEEFAEEFSISTDGCDTDDKDAIYAGIYQLVRYVNQVNIDALQSMSQLGNLASQIDKLISAATGGLTPFDEVASYVEFLMTELIDEYEATVDEALLETVTCDLFCIAIDSNCTINLSDVINYYGSKIGSTALDLTNSLLNVMQFAATGTFSGDEYFYFMTTFQFITVALTDHFFDVDSMENYKTQILAGMNSPDNDWTLLCDECPPIYRLLTHNFAYGMGEFEFLIAPGGSSCPGDTLGIVESGRIKGVHCGAQNAIGVTMPLDTTDRLRGVKLYLERRNGITNGTYDQETVTMVRAAGNVNFIQGGFRENGVIERCGRNAVAPYYHTTGTALEIRIGVFYDADPLSEIFLDKVELLFEPNHAPDRAVIIYDDNICD